MTSTEASPSSPRQTRQRALIASALADTDQWLTAQQVHHSLVASGQSVGLATVYRTLAAMASAGQVDATRTGGEQAYRRCSPDHHHHLTCRHCGRTVEITAPPLERWAAAVASEYGFGEIDHIIEITGVCPTCQPL